MAQPAQFIVSYIAAMTVTAGKTYTTADILTAYPTANVLILKTRTNGTPIKVSISGTDAFEIVYDDNSYIETGNSYVFTADCTLAIAKYISAV